MFGFGKTKAAVDNRPPIEIVKEVLESNNDREIQTGYFVITGSRGHCALRPSDGNTVAMGQMFSSLSSSFSGWHHRGVILSVRGYIRGGSIDFKHTYIADAKDVKYYFRTVRQWNKWQSSKEARHVRITGWAILIS